MKKIKIEVEKREPVVGKHDWIAYVSDNNGIWEAGKTKIEAIMKLEHSLKFWRS